MGIVGKCQNLVEESLIYSYGHQILVDLFEKNGIFGAVQSRNN